MSFGFSATTGGTSQITSDAMVTQVRQSGSIVANTGGEYNYFSSQYGLLVPAISPDELFAFRATNGPELHSISGTYGMMFNNYTQHSINNDYTSYGTPFSVDYAILSNVKSAVSGQGMVIKNSAGGVLFNSNDVGFRIRTGGVYRSPISADLTTVASFNITIPIYPGEYIVMCPLWGNAVVQMAGGPNIGISMYYFVRFNANSTVTLGIRDFWWVDSIGWLYPPGADIQYMIGTIV